MMLNSHKTFFRNDGFVLISFIGLLFTMTAALSIYWYLAAQLQFYSKSLQICRSEVLKSQAQAGEQISALLLLNPQILSARSELTLALASLAAATASGNPGAAASARLWVEKVKAHQLLLLSRQKNYLFQGHKALFDFYSQTTEKISRSQTSQKFFKFSVDFQSLPLTQLAIRPVDPAFSPPLYELKEPFMKQQTVQLNWRGTIELIDRSLKKWLPSKMTKSLTCAGSLTAQGTNFSPVLVEAKSFSKSFLF